MFFWLVCEELKVEVNQYVVDEKVRFIYEDYVFILFFKEVSLDFCVWEGINKKMQELFVYMFDDVQLQIYIFMYWDFYLCFFSFFIYCVLLLQGLLQFFFEVQVVFSSVDFIVFYG